LLLNDIGSCGLLKDLVTWFPVEIVGVEKTLRE
jgi:hypothetical protein